VYFARPDTVIDGISVHRARQNMGDKLADVIVKVLGYKVAKSIDVVIPIPETSNTAALSVAQRLSIPYCPAFVKNRYIFRTFIMPGQAKRKAAVKRKLNPMKSEFEGRNVLLVDDSIVRGTTSREIVQMARDAGAKKVYFASCAPPIRNAHVYGIDLASRSELVAYGRDADQIATEIGADAVIYQELDDLIESCHQENPEIKEFEVGVFSGKYITPVSDDYFTHLEKLRGENSKAKRKDAAHKAVAAGVPTAADVQAVMEGLNGSKDDEEESAGTHEISVSERMDVSIHNIGDH
jgi:amidophosphoribosyltransferase